MGRLKESDKIYLQIIEIEKMIEESGAAEGGGAVPIFGKAPRPELFARHAAREANFVDELFITQINFLHQLIRKADFDLAFELEFELITKSPGKIKPERATRLFETIDSFITHHRYSNSIDLVLAIVSKAHSLEFNQKMNATFDTVFNCCLHQNEFEKAQLLLNRTKSISKTFENNDIEQNFVRAAASRFADAPGDKEAFKFKKLNAALEELRMKKVYCREIELFTTVVLELLEQTRLFTQTRTLLIRRQTSS